MTFERSTVGRGDRLDQVIDCARLVAAVHRIHVVAGRGQEDDRGQAGAAPLADQPGSLEPVHARHPHVEQDDGELVLQDQAQRFGARAGDHEILPERLQHLLQRIQTVRLVVDEQDAGDRGAFFSLRLRHYIAATCTGADCS
jgi:hypothetical protein